MGDETISRRVVVFTTQLIDAEYARVAVLRLTEGCTTRDSLRCSSNTPEAGDTTH